MKEILSFLMSFCVVYAVIGGLYFIFPTGRMTKSSRYIITLSVIICFLSIFCVGFKLNVSTDFALEESVSYDTSKITKAIFEKALRDNGINYDRILIFTDKKEDDSIIISKIIVYSSATKEEILKVIGNEAEYEVEVINE